MRYAIFVFAFASLLYAVTTGFVQAQQSKQVSQIDVRQFMSSGEFKAAGLNKLSSQELDALNQWLGKFTLQIYQAAQGGGSGCASVIEKLF